jgi:TonB family protein
VLVPDRKGYVECLEEAARTPALTPEQIAAVPELREGLRREGGEFPSFPRSAIRDGVRGTVFMDVSLAPSGCVQLVTLVRGVAPSLDVAAIDATSTWRYRIPKVDGVTPRIQLRATTTFR